MSYIVIIGSNGRMSLDLQALLTERQIDFRIYSPRAPEKLRVANFEGARGVIDFSSPKVADEIAPLIEKSRTPWVCGTTGWSSPEQKQKLFDRVSKAAPVLFDSNFSYGVEVLCRAAEKLGEALPGPFFITDYHHHAKKDAPSGTALKISERIHEVNPSAKIEFRDIRAGNIPGEHQVFISWEQESIQFLHRAHSKRAFSEGALRALQWIQTQAPGLYSMRDIL